MISYLFNKRIKSRLILVALIALPLLLLSACSNTPVNQGDASTQLSLDALSAEQAGDYPKAATLYQQLAEQSTDKAITYDWLLKAAENQLKSGQSQASLETLAKLNISELSTSQLLRRQLLVAQLALDEGDAERAETALDFDIPEQTDTVTRQQIHKLRITTFKALNQPIGAARSHIALDELIADYNNRRFNQLALWQLLQRAQIEEVQLAQASAFESDELGWLQLAIISRTSPQRIKTRIKEWRGFFPTHPADPAIVDSVLALQNQQIYRPSQIALLLPLQGPLQNAARAVRDGFLAAYYQSDHNNAPSIRVYDVTSGDGQIREDIYTIYQNAVTEGAEFVIGPLSKKSIESLAAQTDLTVPVLALNYIDSSTITTDLLFQFGLSPEDEARQVANRAWDDGHTQAITLTPEGNWGERMRIAFAEHWQSLGGALVESKEYDAKASDFSRPLRSMLHLNQSQSRKRSLQTQLGLDLQFEPRRRDDADFIFLAAFPRQGRLLKPQLKFHRASDIPVYSSSHIYSGIEDASSDRDINGIQFCDTLWTINPDASSLRQQISQLWPQNSQNLLRLYALGTDAFRVIPELSTLQQSQYYSYRGQTGILTMDANKRLHRQLYWAQITNGIPVELPEIIDERSPLLLPNQ